MGPEICALVCWKSIARAMPSIYVFQFVVAGAVVSSPLLNAVVILVLGKQRQARGERERESERNWQARSGKLANCGP